MKTLQLFYECWLEVTKQKRYHDKWLTDETYFRAIKAQFPTVESLGFDRGKLNRAISTHGGETLDDFTESNCSGRFRRETSGYDPYGNPLRRIWGYYVTVPGGKVVRLPSGAKNFLSLLQDKMIGDHFSVARGVTEVVDLTTEITEQSSAKRKADAKLTAIDEAKKPKHGSPAANILVETYWDSPEAKKLFLGDSNDERGVVEVLEQRIERLQQANKTSDGWRDIIDKHDKDNLCTSYDIFIIRQRCSILCLAYIYALEEMNSVRWAKKLANGLDAYSMNKGYGGAQPRMRESIIKENDGYLGMHLSIVSVGDKQSFNFQPGDEGPFWMTEEQRQLNLHDRILSPRPGNPTTRNKTIVELKLELGPLNVLSDRRQYRLAELQEIARLNNIDPKIEKTRRQKGWEGQPKGLLQVLWERGWIDEGQLEKYTMDPATDDDGEVLEGAEDWSLKCLMASCLDFAQELTALQHVGSELGVSVIITPKSHCELAGEGIEYSWGVTKGVYRRKPLNSKRGKQSFKVLVHECTSREILSTKTVRKLSRRARAYISAYYSLYESKHNGDDNTQVLTLPLIERVVKAFKNHRAAIDFDAGFVNGFVPVLQSVIAKN